MPLHASTPLIDNLEGWDDPPTRSPVALADVPPSAASRRRREHEDQLPDRYFNGRPPVSGSPLPALAHSRAGACQPRTPTPPCSCVSILRPPLTRPLIGALTRSIHIDLPTASDASDTPKMKETPPLVAGIEIPTGGAVSGDAGDEESAPIGDGPTRPNPVKVSSCEQIFFVFIYKNKRCRFVK